MAGTHKAASGQNRAKLHDSFGEHLADSFGSETKQFAQQIGASARDALFGDFGTNGNSETFDQNSLETDRTKKEKTPEVSLFSYKEYRMSADVNQEIRQLISDIRREIMALEREHKGMLSDAAKITVEALPEKPGIYHIRFLEWVLRTIRDLRKKVSESATWFSMLSGKRGKMGYWGMFKKHGTNFAMSNERAIATQAG